MGLSIYESETVKLFIKNHDIEVARRMYVAGEEKYKILKYTEITEDEFLTEVINWAKK